MTIPTQWTGANQNCWRPVGETTATLPAGFYSLSVIESFAGRESYLKKEDPKHDKAIVVADSISNHIINSIKRFRESRDAYKRFNQLHKRGMLLEGPPGSGKTMSAMLAGEWHVAQGGVVVFPAYPSYFFAMPDILDKIRTMHPALDLLCIIEEVDDEDYDEVLMINLLDGQLQIDNVYYILTTNHIDRVSSRLCNRPKRLDEVIHVGAPSAEARRSYLDQMVPADQPMRKEAITAMVDASNGMMLAHLSDLMVSYLLLDQPLEQVAARLSKMFEADDVEMVGGGPELPQVIELNLSDLRRPQKKRRR